MILVEADVSEDWDSRTDWPALAERSVRAAVAHSRHAGLIDREVEVSVKFTSDAEVRALERRLARQGQADQRPLLPDGRGSAIWHAAPSRCSATSSSPTASARPRRPTRRWRSESHAAHLVVHGTLHLLGYDHETSEADAEQMEEIERRALASIGIADPYQVTEVDT